MEERVEWSGVGREERLLQLRGGGGGGGGLHPGGPEPLTVT